MKNFKKLTRNHKIYLSKRGINEDMQRGLRFFKEVNGEPIFVTPNGDKVVVKKEEGMVAWEN